MDDPIAMLGNGVRFIIAAIGTSFVIGAIFWAGATYNRIDSMDKHMGSVDSSIGTIVNKLNDVQNLQIRVDEHEKQLERMENEIRVLK